MEGPSLGVQITLDSQVAMMLKPDLGLLVIGKLTSPTVFEGEFTHEATLTSPDDIVLKNHMLDVHIMSMWVYDVTTGRIYAKVDAKDSR